MDEKLFFHLLDLTILNSFILLASYGAKVKHRDFRHFDQRTNTRGGKVPSDSDCPQGKTNSYD
jgi:hypothetical protein